MKLRTLLLLTALFSLALTSCKKDDDDNGGSDPCASYPNPTLRYTETEPTTPAGMVYATSIVDDGLAFYLRTNTSGAGGTYSYSVQNSEGYLIGDFELGFVIDSLLATGTAGTSAAYQIDLIDSATATVIYRVRLTKTPDNIAVSYGDPGAGMTSFGPISDLSNTNISSTISVAREGDQLDFSATLPAPLTAISQEATVITTGIQLEITLTGTVNTSTAQKTAIQFSDVTLDNADGTYPQFPFRCPGKIIPAAL